MLTKKLLLAATAAFAIAAPVHAHNAWLKPSTTVLSDTTQSVTVDAASSTNVFEANHAAMPVENIQVVKPDGTAGAVENAARGRYRSTFDVKIDMPGTWRIGTSSAGVQGSFKVDGVEWRVGRRRGPAPGATPGAAPAAPAAPPAPPAGAPAAAPGGFNPANMVASIAEIPANATDIVLTETAGRNEFFVTAGSPTDTVFASTGKGLEFVPVTAPNDLVSDEPGQFRFLIDGKPAAGLKVDVIADGYRYRTENVAMELTTDADGLLTIEWPVAGMYWISTSAEDDKPTEAKASKRRMNYVATLEVLAP